MGASGYHHDGPDLGQPVRHSLARHAVRKTKLLRPLRFQHSGMGVPRDARATTVRAELEFGAPVVVSRCACFQLIFATFLAVRNERDSTAAPRPDSRRPA